VAVFNRNGWQFSPESALVGGKLVSIAFEGIAAAISREKIPTPREIIELHVDEQKEYFVEAILIAHCAIMLESTGSLDKLSLEIARSALASCHWGIDYGDDHTSEIKGLLEKIVFANREVKIAFVRDTIEPYLNHGAEHITGLYQVMHNEDFSDIAGQIAVEWIETLPNLSHNSLRELIITSIRDRSNNNIAEQIHHRVADEKWDNDDQRNIWMGAAFLLNFDRDFSFIEGYVNESKEHLWSLRAISFPDRRSVENWPQLNAEQLYFLIVNFGVAWENTGYPSGGWSGDRNPWDASNFIKDRVDDLAADISDQAEEKLNSLIGAQGLEGYQNHIKHCYAQQLQRKVEKNKEPLQIEDIKRILLQGEPANHEDLQALLIDKIEELQNRIRNSPTNDILPYWKEEIPQDENYCRDRIASAIAPVLDVYNIRIHTEGSNAG
jgi:hypothetical protein